MRIFFDTNVLLAAYATRGLCAELLAEHELLIGEVVLAEFREKLRTKFKMDASDVDEIERALRECEVIPCPATHLGMGISDPDDEWIVASAVSGRAEVLVTGDAAVLAVDGRVGFPIVSLRGLWELPNAEASRL